MSLFYEPNKDKLERLIEDATRSSGATILIPNLQRAYVWRPEQVTLLIDSLIKGWPFGSLLLWAVDPSALANDTSPPMPKRSLWSLDSRVAGIPSKDLPEAKDPTPYRMVLDGQQRLQSLVLAFKGMAYGFIMYDHEWAKSLEQPPRRETDHWSRGCLCVDLIALVTEYATHQVLEWIEFPSVLKWVVMDPAQDKSPGRTAAQLTPLTEFALGLPLIPLSKFWEVATVTNVRKPDKYETHLASLFGEFRIDANVTTVIKPSCERLVDKLEELKATDVQYLQVLPFSSAFDLDQYNDAVINIFTRLNSAGRALTKQEITFAWIKTYWVAGVSTGNRPADRCFADLGGQLEDQAQLYFDADDLVRGMSSVWAVLFSDGVLLSDRDLLKGAKLKPIASDLATRWDVVAGAVLRMSERIANVGLRFRETYYSLNALFVLWSLEAVVRNWPQLKRLNVTDGDSFEKGYEEFLDATLDRWFLLSQWGGEWAHASDTQFEKYLKELAALRLQLSTLSDWRGGLMACVTAVTSWIDGFKPAAIGAIDALSATSRASVRQYYGPLWIWNRLDSDRYEMSKIPLRESHRRKSKLLETDVDHIVAVQLWRSKTTGTLSGDREAGVINSLGNCWLLEKTFNISKSAQPAYEFLAKVQEFRNDTAFVSLSRSFRIKGSLLRPTGREKDRLARLIDLRERRIKDDLKQYVQGQLKRIDL